MERLTRKIKGIFGIKIVDEFNSAYELSTKKNTLQVISDLQNGIDKLGKYEDTGLTPEEILDGKLLTGWIPITEQLPEEPEEGMTDMEDLQEYIVTIDGAQKSTTLSYAGNGQWYRDGAFYKVVSWMPLPII